MKHVALVAPLCALVLLTACRPSPEKLMATANKYHDNKKYKEAAIFIKRSFPKIRRMVRHITALD